MIYRKEFEYQPNEYEKRRASNSYVMSLAGFLIGPPLPIINLIATFIFYLGNKKSTYFVRWHCTQALLSQVSVLIINTAAFWWTVSVIWRDTEVTNAYIAYILCVLGFNLAEFIATIYTAIQTGKGHHIAWWFYGGLTGELVHENTFDRPSMTE